MATALRDLPKYLVLDPVSTVRIEMRLEAPACEIDVELDNPRAGRSFVLLIGQVGGPVRSTGSSCRARENLLRPSGSGVLRAAARQPPARTADPATPGAGCGDAHASCGVETAPTDGPTPSRGLGDAGRPASPTGASPGPSGTSQLRAWWARLRGDRADLSTDPIPRGRLRRCPARGVGRSLALPGRMHRAQATRGTLRRLETPGGSRLSPNAGRAS